MTISSVSFGYLLDIHVLDMESFDNTIYSDLQNNKITNEPTVIYHTFYVITFYVN